VALALPETDSQTVWLEMSRDEQMVYGLHACADGVPTWADESRTTTCTLKDLNKGRTRRRGAAAHVYQETIAGKRKSPHSDAMISVSIHRPVQEGLRPAACKALEGMCKDARGAFAHTERVAAQLEGTTKGKALLADLKQLQSDDPTASIVCFTHFNELQAELVALLRSQRGFTVFDVSAKTPPERRQKAIREFQDRSGQMSAKAFVTTFDMCAVGVTLTAASRVYLLEPALNLAMEAQAAGRIHRLGQSKEVLIKRFAYKKSIEEAVLALHAKIRGGELELTGGTFPKEALACLRQHGVTQPHTMDSGAPATKAQRRYRSGNGPNMRRHGGLSGMDYGREVFTKPCRACGKAVEMPGTSIWWGNGCMAYLEGNREDVPRLTHGSGGYFAEDAD
jgi:SWI/SNF-related matrix-associated actin-dependent regulator of chromatin subfamily A3